MIHYEDAGFSYEYWGARGYYEAWVLVDDDGNETDEECPLYITVEKTRNGKKEYREIFIDEKEIISELRHYFPNSFSKRYTEDYEEVIEYFDNYELEEIIDDPELVCERYCA